ncbi:hypothetical protein GGG16DRAFT_114799 [Schizophyllum commune]
MVRCEMKEGKHITIAYGSDEFIGYLLSVYDDRLAPNIEASEAVNKICNVDDPAVEKACGAYLQLTTDDKPNVEKVAKETLAVFYERYGVPQAQIKRMWQGVELEGTSKVVVEWKQRTRRTRSLLGWHYEDMFDDRDERHVTLLLEDGMRYTLKGNAVDYIG